MPLMGIPGTGLQLEADALKWYLKMRADGMPAGGINSAYRSLAEQEKLFFDRYMRTEVYSQYDGPYKDVRWYKGERYVRMSSHGPVAVPGTSTHTLGRALDISTASTVHAWMVAHAPAYGWKRTLWDAHNLEPWHWEWHPSRVTITDQEEVMTPEQEKKLDGLITIARRLEDRVAGNIDGPIPQAASDSRRAALRLGGSIEGVSITEMLRAQDVAIAQLPRLLTDAGLSDADAARVVDLFVKRLAN